jgi:hypothetical protein
MTSVTNLSYVICNEVFWAKTSEAKANLTLFTIHKVMSCWKLHCKAVCVLCPQFVASSLIVRLIPCLVEITTYNLPILDRNEEYCFFTESEQNLSKLTSLSKIAMLLGDVPLAIHT